MPPPPTGVGTWRAARLEVMLEAKAPPAIVHVCECLPARDATNLVPRVHVHSEGVMRVH